MTDQPSSPDDDVNAADLASADATSTDRSSPTLPLGAERNLVERAASGEQKAMGDLYDAYLPRVYRFCLSRVRDASDAEDMAEEIFLKVLGAIEKFEWRSLGTAEQQRSPFAAWLFRIARNHVVSFHRKNAVRGQTTELSESIRDQQRGPQELTETKIAIEEVFEAVRGLPEAQREVVLLRFAAGLTVAETAETLGKQQTNVKVLQHKGVQRLKKILLESEDSAEPTPIDSVIRRQATS